MSDHFDRLGLPRRFVIDAGELERAYLARSRAVHPDYHLAGPSADLGASLELSAAVNEAYNTLRDPFTRAEHLLALEGGPGPGEQKDVPPAFLMEVLDLREQVEAARGNATATERLATAFAARYDAQLATVGALFARLDGANPTERATVLKQARAALNAAKYVRGLIRDFDPN
jgi:molecular chaperone HscB